MAGNTAFPEKSAWPHPASALILAMCLVLIVGGHAQAQSSLGIGAAEPGLSSGGPLAGVLQWVNARQEAFYRALTDALKEMREGGGGLWLLVGLSFAYGVFHAAGPGHGKAVISSYMLANEVALRRGVALSFLSSMLQAVTAIAVMGAVFLLLRGSAVSMTDAGQFLETASFALVAAFGAWLLLVKVRRAWRRALAAMPMRSLSAAHAGEHAGHGHGHDRDHEGFCAACGHSHAPDPEKLQAERLDWRSAAAAVASVGIRPCSGAIIVLTFAFLNGLWLGGVFSVFAMALGTAITVSALAVLAVTAKSWAVAIAGGGALGMRIHTAVEIAGAGLILVLGLVLLAASLS